MQSIRIEIKQHETTFIYIDNGNKIFSYDFKIGDDYCRERNYSKLSGLDWWSYVLWCIHTISYIDRVPDKIYLSASSNGAWYAGVLSMQSYTQFYIKTLSNSTKPHVIIDNNNSSKKDARYQKTIAQFKI